MDNPFMTFEINLIHFPTSRLCLRWTAVLQPGAASCACPIEKAASCGKWMDVV